MIKQSQPNCGPWVLMFLLISAGSAQTWAAELWPQWRGPQRDSQISFRTWPSDLSEEHLVSSWSVPLGPSYSGPIVSADLVLVTETKDEAVEVVRALDRSSGQQVWERQWPGSMKVPFFAAANGSWIRATPALDGGRLYVAGMRDLLVCLDVGTGEVLWELDFVKATGSSLPSFGFVSSPLVLEDAVYVQAGASFAKVDKLTGEILWQTLQDDGGMQSSAFSSPVAATIAGVDQIVVQTRTKLAGVDPDDGTVLWSQTVPAFRGMNILTPTIIGDGVFTSSYGGRSYLFHVAHDGSEWKVSEAWQHRSQGYMSSPVVIDGHIYMHLRNQRFICLDAENGEECWTSTPYGKYCSMVVNQKMLLALDQRGELLLIEATPEEFRLIDQRKVADDTWAHLAVVDEEIFIRDLAATKRFEWK